MPEVEKTGSEEGRIEEITNLKGLFQFIGAEIKGTFDSDPGVIEARDNTAKQQQKLQNLENYYRGEMMLKPGETPEEHKERIRHLLEESQDMRDSL